MIFKSFILFFMASDAPAGVVQFGTSNFVLLCLTPDQTQASLTVHQTGPQSSPAVTCSPPVKAPGMWPVKTVGIEAHIW